MPRPPLEHCPPHELERELVFGCLVAALPPRGSLPHWPSSGPQPPSRPTIRLRPEPADCRPPQPEPAANDALIPRQWRLIWTVNPAHEATLSWSTLAPGEIHRVHYRSADGREEGIVACSQSGQFTAGNEKVELYYHHARLTRLNAARQYRIVLESDGRHRASSTSTRRQTMPDPWACCSAATRGATSRSAGG